MRVAPQGESLIGGGAEGVSLAALPGELSWQVASMRWSARDGKRLTIEAGPRTDLFTDPQGSDPVHNAPRLLTPLWGDFILSALVTVGFVASFDAGVLLIYLGDRSWAKLCFEFSPQASPMVVSVVTRGVSDDANSMTIDAHSVWLRVARLGAAYAFHASIDGTKWRLVRHFALETDDAPQVGFAAQSPTGDGCTVTFEDIRYEPRRLTDLRNGG